MPAVLLLVEDDADIREILTEVLHEDGFEVHASPDALQALSWLEGGGRPAAILLDYHLPVVDGLEFRRRQQANAALAAIPVVMITADVRLARTNPLAVHATVAKPFDVASLLDTVHRVAGTPDRASATNG